MSWKNATEPLAGQPPAAGRTPWSLAARLTAWYTASAFALVLGATGSLYWALNSSLDRENDLVLADQVHVLRVLLQERPGDAEALRQEVELEPSGRLHSQLYIRVLGGGQPTLETPGMGAALPAEA